MEFVGLPSYCAPSQFAELCHRDRPVYGNVHDDTLGTTF